MPNRTSFSILLLLLAAVFSLTYARILHNTDQIAESNSRYTGRVQMKVFRGPTAESGDWAPHGYWVRQPADDQRR